MVLGASSTRSRHSCGRRAQTRRAHGHVPTRQPRMSRFYVTTPIYYVNAVPHLGHVLHDGRRRRARALPPRALRQGERLLPDRPRRARAEDRAHRARARRWSRRPTATRSPRSSRRPGSASASRTTTSSAPPSRATRRRSPRCGSGSQAAGDIYAGRVRRHVLRRLRGGQDRGRRRSSRTARRSARSTGTPVERVKEKNYFFRLSKYARAAARAGTTQTPSPVPPESRRNEVRAFVESGLRDLSVSRHERPSTGASRSPAIPARRSSSGSTR